MEPLRRPSDPKRTPNSKDKSPKDPSFDADDADDDDEDLVADDDKKRRPPISSSSSPAAASASRRGSGGGGVATPCCQAEKCTADLAEAKRYHRRHKVCELHSKAAFVVVAGLRQRFCQQCSRFHELLEFDEAKRSCRRRLAGHNERRRKSSSESQGEGSSRCRQADQGGGTMQISIPGNPAYKHFQIR